MPVIGTQAKKARTIYPLAFAAAALKCWTLQGCQNEKRIKQTGRLFGVQHAFTASSSSWNHASHDCIEAWIKGLPIGELQGYAR
eukprot:6208325-Pleurochrysis_carterae.AAC.3